MDLVHMKNRGLPLNRKEATPDDLAQDLYQLRVAAQALLDATERQNMFMVEARILRALLILQKRRG